MRFVAVGHRSACDEGIQKADVQTLARGSSQLGGAEDGGDQADPSRIEERLGGVANVATDRLEQVEPVSEKRPLFGKELLEVGEVQNHLIGFDLSEVGIEGGVQGQASSDCRLQVESKVYRRIEKARPRSGGIRKLGPECSPGGEIGNHLDVGLLFKAAHPRQVAEARYEAIRISRDEHAVDHLMSAREIPTH